MKTKTTCLPIVSFYLLALADSAEARRPNIIIMQPDDMSVYDAWGRPPNNPNDPYATVPLPAAGLPNIERLRTQGLQMMQAYSAGPVCGTSRFSTITGKYPSRAATSRVQNRREDVANIMIRNTKLEDRDGINDCSEGNIAVALKAAGYRTGMVGKWHLSRIQDSDYTYEYAQEVVKRCGFDFVDGLYIENLGSVGVFSDGTFSHNMEWITSEALRFIDYEPANDDEPFLLYFNPTVPHPEGPIWDAIDSDIFSCRDTPKGTLASDPVIKGMTEEHGSCRTYRDTVIARAHGNEDAVGSIWVDDSVGALLQFLEDRGMLDDTIFIFQGDHGIEPKSSLFEGGIRIPQFVHYPAWPPSAAGGEFDAPVANIDLVPTLLEFAGTTLPYEVDGISWKDAVENVAIEEDWKANRCLMFENQKDWAARCGCSKLMQIHELTQSASTTYARSRSRGYNLALNNLYDLCDGGTEYITTGTSLEENSVVGQATSAYLEDVMNCHAFRTHPAVTPDYSGCGQELLTVDNL